MEDSSNQRKRTVLAVVPQVLLLLLIVWFVWGLDVWAGVSLQPLGYLVVIVSTVVLLSIFWLIVRRPAVAVAPGLCLLFLIALPFLNNSSIKPLLRGAADLEPGMDREAVIQTLNARYMGTDYPGPVLHSEEPHRLYFKPQGRDPGFNAEGLLVFMDEDGFTHYEFSPD